MGVTRNTGAARWFTEQQLGGPSRAQESTPSIAATVTQLVQNNPDRVGLVVVNQGTSDVNISLVSTVSTTSGIRLAAQGGFAAMNVKEDYILPASQWFAISIAGTMSVYVLEVISDIILSPEQTTG